MECVLPLLHLTGPSSKLSHPTTNILLSIPISLGFAIFKFLVPREESFHEGTDWLQRPYLPFVAFYATDKQAKEKYQSDIHRKSSWLSKCRQEDVWNPEESSEVSLVFPSPLLRINGLQQQLQRDRMNNSSDPSGMKLCVNPTRTPSWKCSQMLMVESR